MKTINYTDVRIGNLVDYQGKIYEIDTIAKEFPTLNTDEFGIGVVHWNDLKGVELTEEWLVEKSIFYVTLENTAGKTYNIFNYGISDSDIKIVFFNKSSKFFRKDLEIIFVHQLQNLYHSIKGKELIIKN